MMQLPALMLLLLLLAFDPSAAVSEKGRKLADTLDAVDSDAVEATTGFFDFGEDDFMDFSLGGDEEEEEAFAPEVQLLPPCQNLTLAEQLDNVPCTNDTVVPTEPPELRYPDQLFQRLLGQVIN